MRQTALQKAYRRLETDGRKHCIVLYSAMGIVLWNEWGKRKTAISNVFDVSRTIWKDCAKDHDHSMIAMCEAETGIEVQNESWKSWHDVWFLNGYLPETMTSAQVLYMRQQQLKWIRPQVMACMLIALHRKYGFGFERCSRIYAQIQDIEAEYKANPERLRRACFEMTGIDVAETTTTDRRESA